MSKFSERLKACMEEMDIKPSELSKLTGIDKSSISRYLKGDYVPKQLKITALADALHVDPGWLFTGVKKGGLIKMSLSEFLRNYRAEHKLSMDDLAKRCGLSKPYISMLEKNRNSKNGKSIIPSIRTYEKIAHGVGLTVDSLMKLINGNERVALMSSDISSLKNIIPTEKHMIPVIGTIAAGEPILCDEHIELLLPCDADLNADFALRVHGDSMIDVGYFDGDIVFIHQQPAVDDGQIAAVRIDDSATLKRFYKIPGGCMLLPENAKYKAMTFTSENCDNIAIIGIPVAKYTKHVAQ